MCIREDVYDNLHVRLVYSGTPLYSGHPEMRTLFAVSNAVFVYNLTPKTGYLTNHDTFQTPKGVRIREVPL